MALVSRIRYITRVNMPGNAGDWPVATVQITQPDELAKELTDAGLLEAPVIEAMLRERLRTAHIANPRTLRGALRASEPFD